MGNGSKPAGKGPQGRFKAKERPPRHVKEELSLARTRARGGEGMASRGTASSKLRRQETPGVVKLHMAWFAGVKSARGRGER